MRAVAKKSLAIASTVGIAGVSSLFFGAAPASATAPSCGAGVLLAGNVCEQTFTSLGNTTFDATAKMTKLQVLLVGGGGDGGYGGGGGGGAVKIVDFDGTGARTLNLTVGGTDQPSSVTLGADTVTANAGTDATNGGTSDAPAPGVAGASGSGFLGAPENSIGGGGGGAAGSPTTRLNGGAGTVAFVAPTMKPSGTAVTPTFPLFANDRACYGGGGAIGDSSTQGIPGCSGGSVTGSSGVTAPPANFGGGGGAFLPIPNASQNPGASGVIVVRWNATPAISLKFHTKHGHAPATQYLLSGLKAAKPVSPSAHGYVFKGWYTSSSYKTKASFTKALTKSSNFYAKFAKK